ncbi:hypothetical protein U1707_10345 [Sphingomonas sp. PB2P12]|uniref:hypothetical protein n=1 Tax=Sphingomonas sandaracina TaxID=3096157 RepID=UPI002FC8255F
MASNDFAARAALYVADWAAGKVADVIIDRTTKRVVRAAKARTIDHLRSRATSYVRPAAGGAPDGGEQLAETATVTRFRKIAA